MYVSLYTGTQTVIKVLGGKDACASHSVCVCVCPDLIDRVVVGVVKAIGAPGLGETSAGLHLLLLLIQQRLQEDYVITA